MVNRPTDNELEAMAVRLGIFANGVTDKAAAMLRACKAGDAALLRECAGREVCWCGETSPEAQADCPLKGCGLEPAPDHAEWDAAIEAAVVIATDWTLGPEEIAPAIRTLKKGQPQ